MKELKNIITDKANNIGSLCLFINKRDNYVKEINNYIDNELIEKTDVKKLSLSQKIYIYFNDDSNIFCDCGKLKNWKSFKYGWTKTCGNRECINKSTINTNIHLYGVDNPMKNEKIKKLSQERTFEKYGFTSASKNDEIKQKISIKLNSRTKEEKLETIKKRIEKWENKDDVERNKISEKRKETINNTSLEDKNKTTEKRKETCLKKYNSEYAITSKDVREKILNTFNDKFNGNSPFCDSKVKNKALDSYKKQHIEYIKNNVKKSNCEYVSHIDKGNANIEYVLLCLRTNNTFTIGYSNLRIRILGSLEISPYFRQTHGKSEMEEKLYLFIKKNYNGEILINSRNIISPVELDIYLPELKLALEFNGLYWHSEAYKNNNYHLTKTEECEKYGIQLIQIYEDDWIYKQDIIKSMILNKLNKSENKIYARKCKIKEIADNKLVRDFLNKNHIQGFIGSKIKLGLFYNNELVSLMTFGNLRIAMGKKETVEGEYELLRFCNKIDTNVIGGASKLFKYFINNYNSIEIISYADRSISQGKLYETLGFKYQGKTTPNYYYIVDDIKRHRFNFRKDVLVKQGYDKNKTEHEIMLERKILRIYDSGNLKFIYTKK